MSKTCGGCGGVVGRDCFNPIECMYISYSIESGKEQLIESLSQRVKVLEEYITLMIKNGILPDEYNPLPYPKPLTHEDDLPF